MPTPKIPDWDEARRAKEHLRNAAECLALIDAIPDEQYQISQVREALRQMTRAFKLITQ